MDSNTYPIYLLPQGHYKRISYRPEFIECYLLRVTPDKDYRDELTKNIRDTSISNPTSHALNYSISILGIYTSKEVRFYIKDNRENPKGYHQDWVVGTMGIIPDPVDVLIDDSKGCLYFNFDKIQSLKPKYINEFQQEEILYPQIEHKPTNCNFWHFEVTWLNERSQDPITLPRKFKDRAASGIKSNLRQIASEEVPGNFFMLEKIDYES